MNEEIFLPRMGQTMTEGTIDAWLRKDGDMIAEGEDVAEITTDKVTTTITAPRSGVLKIWIEEGNTVPVGEVIAEIIG
jgi:pyruvate/2-oxoglutarate dehydrogenase complex dihydrolipoamide acyltransferase (E2) component